MKIDNEFRVSAPVETAWALLTDIPTIAPCMPGAQLTGSNGDEHEGKVKIKVGPITSEYKGKATFIEKDDAAHKAVIKAEGRDSRGAGNASANITATMKADGDATVVSIDTDLKITGKVAQFGRGVIVDVSEKLLGQFVDCLEEKLMTVEQDAGKIAGASADAGAGAAASGAAAAASGAAATATGAVGDVASGAAGKMTDAASGAVGGVTGGAAAASGAAGKLGDAASGVTGGVTGAASGAAGKLGDAVGGAAGGVTGAASGGIGKAAAAGAAGAAALGGAAAAAKGMGGSAGSAVGGAADEVEALDLGELAGGAVFKRFIPVAIAAIVIIALIIWLLAR